MRPTKEIVIGDIRIEVFGSSEHPGVEDVREQKEILFSLNKTLEELEVLRSYYSELGLSFLLHMVEERIESIRISAIKGSCISPTGLLGYVLVPGDLTGDLNLLSWGYRTVDEYRDPIPLEVLEIWKQAKDYGIFGGFTIFTSREKGIADNVLIAYFGQVPYIILRWGTELVPFEQLTGKAEAAL